jgi:hypothetical protein
MNIPQEALTLMRQTVDETMAANLKMAALASLLTSGDLPPSQHGEELAISSSEAEGLARQFIAGTIAQNLQMAAFAAALTGVAAPGSGHNTPRFVQQVDGGPNVIKPPVGTGPHDL